MEYESGRIFGACIAVLIGGWVMVDASKRGMSGLATFLWGSGAFALCCAFLPLYLMFRPPLPSERYDPRQADERDFDYLSGVRSVNPAAGVAAETIDDVTPVSADETTQDVTPGPAECRICGAPTDGVNNVCASCKGYFK